MTTATRSTWQPTPKKKRGPWPWAAAAVGALMVALLLWLTLRGGVPKPTGNPVAVAKYVGSDAFEKLPPDKQQPYREAMMATMKQGNDALAGLSDDDRRAAMRNLWRAQGRERMAAFFDLKTKAERDAYLDDMMKNRGNRSGGGGGGGRGNRPPGGQNGQGSTSAAKPAAGAAKPAGGTQQPDRPARNIFQRPDPVEMAQHAEMIGAMRRRMEETGQSNPWSR